MNAGAGGRNTGRTQEYGGERRGRRGCAEFAEGIQKLFKKACSQYPCGLQAENGLKGAWELVVVVFGFCGLALLGLGAMLINPVIYKKRIHPPFPHHARLAHMPSGAGMSASWQSARAKATAGDHSCKPVRRHLSAASICVQRRAQLCRGWAAVSVDALAFALTFALLAAASPPP